MRLSSLSLAVVLAFSSYLSAQHHPGGGGSSGSSGGGSSSSSSSSSGGYSGGSGNSGGSSGASSHSSGGGYSPSNGSSHSSGGGYSPSAGSSHNNGPSHGSGHNSGGGYSPSGANRNSVDVPSSRGSGHGTGAGHPGGENTGTETSGNHRVSGVHISGGDPISDGPHGKNDRASHLANSRRADIENRTAKMPRSIREPRPVAPGRIAEPQKRSFFSFLRHPFRKPQPRVEAHPNLYLSKPICLRGRCAPPCPVGQVSSRGACVTPPITACLPGQIPTRTGIGCGHSTRHHCYPGEIWNGGVCIQQNNFLDSCFALRRSLQRQQQRVQAAEATRRSACADGPAQECSEATAAWQSEENLRQSLLLRYQQCQMQSIAANSMGFGLSAYDSTPWLDDLRFDFDH